MALAGNIPVIPTPFLNGEVDYRSFDRLIDRTVQHVEGYVVCGSTGEAPSLTAEVRKEIAAYFARKVPHKEIVIGLGHTNLEEAVEIGKTAAAAGIRSALVPSPYYFPNSVEMVARYMKSLGERTGLSLVFYDNPVTTKTFYTAEELIAIAGAVPQIKAVKMTDHDFGKIRKLKTASGLSVFGGDDIVCFRGFEAGVDGNMIIAPIVYPEEFSRCWKLYRSGRKEESFRLFSEQIMPFIHMFGPGDEIATTKALFHQLGVFSSPQTLLPLLPSDENRVRETLLGYEAGLKNAVQ